MSKQNPNRINVAGSQPLNRYRINGRTTFEYLIPSDISIANNAEFNIFNSVNGILSTPANLTISGDAWDRMTAFDSEYIRPDEYSHTEESFFGIETDIFLRVPTNIGGAVVRGIVAEIRRRTAGSPATPLPISGREIEILTNTAVTTASVQRLPTRSEGSTDNYYVYGYTLFLINESGATIILPAGDRIRFSALNHYRRPILFQSLISPNV